jgi:undecaprenyl-diphosphatase
MDIIEAVLLGILQGITEFLPISSSGHLVLAQAYTGVSVGGGITFEVVVHFGSLFSILVYFRERIAQLLTGLWRYLSAPSQWRGGLATNYEARICFYILLSMIPAGVVGLTMKDLIEAQFQNEVFVSAMLIVTGFILYSTKFAPQGTGAVTPMKAFLVGVSQAVAILPGISRSGTTISTGTWLGIKREDMADFSFLMVLPVIAGVTLLDLKDLAETGASDQAVTLLVAGFLASFISGYFALKTLISIFKKRGLHPFAVYCWVVGGVSLVWFSLK